MQFEAFYQKGRLRSVYQDFLACSDVEIPENVLIRGETNSEIVVMADGMGGLRDGDVASEFVAKEFLKLFEQESDISEAKIRTNILATHDALINFSRNRFGFTCMGSTLCAVLNTKENIWVANVGDTRAYVVREQKIDQVTVDDYSDPDETSVLTQCIGGKGDLVLKPHILKLEKSSNLSVILCTDGFYRAMDMSTGLDTFLSGDTTVSNEDDATFIKLTV